MLVKFTSFLKIDYHFHIESHEHYTSLTVYPKKFALGILCMSFWEYKEKLNSGK